VFNEAEILAGVHQVGIGDKDRVMFFMSLCHGVTSA
jgi:hypothetical protein